MVSLSKLKRAFLISALLALLPAARAEEIPLTVTPAPPPGISNAIETMLSWLMWIGWVAVAGGFIAGAISLVIGNSERGRRLIISSIFGALIMAFYSAFISGLIY